METTEIMMQMVAANRGVCALPGWLVEEYAKTMDIKSLRFGKTGIQKQINIGIRKGEKRLSYLHEFIALANSIEPV